MAGKDFEPIADDYAFFMAHATEAEADAAAYVSHLAGFAEGRTRIRMLDFGCGTGAFTERLLAGLHWPADLLELTLVEPVAQQRQKAAERLARFSRHPIQQGLPAAGGERFDMILSNHALYYVDDLSATLGQLWALLAPNGQMLVALAGWNNALMKFWTAGFGHLGRPVPYYAAEDIAASLQQQGIAFLQRPVSYALRFPDSEANRLTILRFLFGAYLSEIGADRLLPEFDPYRRGGDIEFQTDCQHFYASLPA